MIFSKFQGNEEYLSVINRSDIVIHGTVYEDNTTKKLEHVPKYVINHGILDGKALHKLLRRAKVSEYENRNKSSNFGCL